jgi:hypothetical protein
LVDGRWIALSHDGWAFILILAPRNVSAIPVTGDQQEGVPALSVQTATGRQSLAADLSTIIDGLCVIQLQTRAWRNKSIQVDHRAVFPQKHSAAGTTAGERLAHHLTPRINGKWLTEAIPGQGSEIGDDAIPP